MTQKVEVTDLGFVLYLLVVGSVAFILSGLQDITKLLQQILDLLKN